MRRAALYRRVSTPGQVDGFSLTVQLERLSELAEAQGYECEDFCDPGLSGEKLEERPALMALLGRLDEFEAVLVVDESRLARSEPVAFAIRGYLREAGVRLVTLQGETDLSDPDESLMSAVRTIFGLAEQTRRTQRMTQGWDRAALEGLWTGGPAPLGYRLAKTPTGHTTLEVDPEGAAFVRMVVGMVVDDGLSVYEAAKRLSAPGYRTRNGELWGHRNLGHHLRRRHLLGEIPYNSAGGPVLRQFPPLIPGHRFADLQAVLGGRTRPTPQKRHTYPFSGRVACECGGRLVGTYRNDRAARYYVCNRAANSAVTGRKCPAHPHNHRADRLETLLWGPIRATLADPGRLQAAALAQAEGKGPDPAELRSRTADRRRRLGSIGEERVRTFRDARQLGLTNPEIRHLLSQLAEEHDTLSRELRTLEAQVRLAESRSDPIAQARRLAQAAVATLDNPTLGDQAALIDLLDIQVTPTQDGYEIAGSIPLTTEQVTTDGKMATREPQHPRPSRERPTRRLPHIAPLHRSPAGGYPARVAVGCPTRGGGPPLSGPPGMGRAGEGVRR
ncbi:MAG TPA: recombinase family protein [Acidimicrobiia bacterium]|nr:recombinase family protein [Acidimicrobiia bacterium]